MVGHGPVVVRELQVRVVHAIELPEHAHEIGLSVEQMRGGNFSCAFQRGPAQMFRVEDPLGRHQLFIEVVQRQARGQDGMLNIEEPIVAGLKRSGFGMPCLGAGIGRIDADIDDLGNLETPSAHRLKACPITVGVRDDVDRDGDSQGSGKLQGLEVRPHAQAFPVSDQAFVVDCFDTEKHVPHPEIAPEPKHVLVPQQHVAPRLQVILLFDAVPGNGLPDLESMLGLDKGHIVDHEDARLLDAFEVLHNDLWADGAVAPPVERPRAAKRAIPWTAACKFDGGARIQDADEIATAMAQKVSGWAERIERPNKLGWGAGPIESDHPRHLPHRVAIMLECFEDLNDRFLALASDDTVNRSVCVPKKPMCDK